MTDKLTLKELKTMAATAATERKAKLGVFEESAAYKRATHEAITIPELEARLNRVWGKDLAIVWLKTGDFAAVVKPLQLKYERYQLCALAGKVEAKDIDDFIAPPTLVYPSTGELEAMGDESPEVKFACALLAQKLGEVDQKTLEGKS
jgi:hypothetical protein